MYELVVLKPAARKLKKLDTPIRMKVIEALDRIAENPFIGEKLKGNLSSLYSWHFNEKNVEYRIAYKINAADIVVIVLMIGTRENFYEELKRGI